MPQASIASLAAGTTSSSTSTRSHTPLCVPGEAYAPAAKRELTFDSSLPPQWSAIEASTSGPYSLTLKSNGCLILISSLDARTLLVTSKHALDTVSERDEEEGYRGGHARVGREWVARHLSRAGRTEKELAGELWNRQVSAVAEVRLAKPLIPRNRPRSEQ